VLLEQLDDMEELEAATPEAVEDEGPVVTATGVQEAKMCYEKRQMVWKGMLVSCWTDLVQQWGAGKVEALQLQKSIAAVMREMGPKLGDLHWREAPGMGQKSRVLQQRQLACWRQPGMQGGLETQGGWGTEGKVGGQSRGCWNGLRRSSL
jgi:hypothetical protein